MARKARRNTQILAEPPITNRISRVVGDGGKPAEVTVTTSDFEEQVQTHPCQGCIHLAEGCREASIRKTLQHNKCWLFTPEKPEQPQPRNLLQWKPRQ